MMSMRNNDGYGQGGYGQALAAAAQCLAPSNQYSPQQRAMINTGACGVPQPRAGQELLAMQGGQFMQRPYLGQGGMQQTSYGNAFPCFDYINQDPFCGYDPYCGPFQVRPGPRRTVLCLNNNGQPILIPAGATMSIPTTVDTPFAGERFVMPSDTAGALLVADIKVRGRSQIICGPLPGRLFTEVSQCCNMIDFDVAGPKDEITVVITNTSRCPVNFTGSIFGVGFRCP